MFYMTRNQFMQYGTNTNIHFISYNYLKEKMLI